MCTEVTEVPVVLRNLLDRWRDRYEEAQEERLGWYCTDVKIHVGREVTVSPGNLFTEWVKTSCFLDRVLDMKLTCWIQDL